MSVIRPRVALVTARPGEHVNPDRDLSALRDAVAAEGCETQTPYWDEQDTDWGAFDLVVLRSTWDYSWRTGEFLAWAADCAERTTLANPLPVLRWNADKRYLGDLAERGVPAVPTTYLAPGDAVELPRAYEYVVKPTTSAGARYAARYRPEDAETALRHVRHMHDEGMTAMVQPYLRNVDSTGERALVFYGGRFLHAVRKNAVLTPGTAYDERKVAHPGLREWEPTAEEFAVAEKALAAAPDAELLYARVDLADDERGEPRVMELELIEPNLFLNVLPGSLPRVAGAIREAAEKAAAGRR